MTKRRSVEQFRKDYAQLVRSGKLAVYRRILEGHKHLTQIERDALIEKFKHDVLEAQRSPGPDSE